MKYKIILADPPWRYDDKSMNRGGAERNYTTMDNKSICELPIAKLADDDCILFMWSTFPKLQEGLDVIRAWGFEYKTCAFVWIKTNKRTDTSQLSFLAQDSFDSFMGMGRWTRSNAEICLLAVKGKIERKSCSVHQIIYEPIMRHSKKPDIVRDKIVQLCGDLPRIELFAREKAEGWSAWGKEVESDLKL